nr:hypothetical protein BdHM001_18570 [Bdellovibrio sp. HM001]
MSHKLTYEQQLIEELQALTEMIGVLTAQQIQDVPRIRDAFRYLSARKTKCERAIKAFRYDPKKTA